MRSISESLKAGTVGEPLSIAAYRRSSITAIARYVMSIDRTYAVSRRGTAFVLMQLRRKDASKLNPNGQREVANEPQDVWIEKLSVRPDPIE